MSRGTKQLLYILAYSALFVFVVGSIYAVLKPPPTCTDGVQNQGEEGVDCGDVCGVICSNKLSPLQERGSARMFSPATGTIAILASVANPNQDYAVKNFSYRIVWQDKDGAERSIPGSTWIYAGEEKYILGFADGEIGFTPHIVFSGAPDWAKKADFPRVDISSRDVQTVKEGPNYRARATIVNNDTTPVSKVEATAVFYDKFNNPVGVAPAQTQGLISGEVREISTVHPALNQIDPLRTAFFLYGLR
jgi:hypothetical protein